MKYSCLIILCFYPIFGYSQQYRIQDIPDSLKENSNAVFFLDEGSHEIINMNKSVYSNHRVVAIFNDAGEKYAAETIGYYGGTKILGFEGRVYDQYGKLIKKSKKSDIYDRSAISGFSLYEDSRLQHLDLEQNRFPYIVEFKFKKEYHQTYSISNWYVNPGSNVSVIKSKYSITSPESHEPNFKFENTEKRFTRKVNNGIVTNTIEFKNLIAREREPYGPYLSRVTPVIRVSPSKFKYENYEGDFSSWESIGLWQQKLNEGRDDISQESIDDIKLLTSKIDNREEKIKAVYEYMQNRTRYVSIQLGIGGWQPFPASTVDELGYGDCKALSNYTKSLLSHIGIPSYYTWVYGGDNPDKVYDDFAYDSFNHIILCVPNEQDTLWLECTSQKNPFGYQGDFTGDRGVMIVTPQGGKVVHTTIYEKEDNLQSTNAKVSLDANGNAKANIKTQYTGLQHENGNLNWIIDDGEDELKKWIYKNTSISNFQVDDFKFDFQKSKIPSITENLSISIHSCASISGTRMILQPNLLNKWAYVPKKVSDRQTNIILTKAFIDTDTVTYHIPTNLEIEYLPEDIILESEFGSYSAQFAFENNTLTYIRKVEREKGSFEKEKYDAFRDFYKSIIKADKSKVVFIK